MLPETLFSAILILILGAAILIAGGEIFVRGAGRLATLLRIPTLIVGLTIVAAATSAPELSVSLIGVIGRNPNPDIAVGNAVGSNIANILLILGLSSVLRPLSVSSGLTKREIPMMIAFSFLLWGIAFFSVKTVPDVETVHRIPLWGGILFLALLALYNVMIVKEAQKDRNREAAGQIAEETQLRSRLPALLSGFAAAAVLLALGLAMLVYGSNMFVAEAKSIARYCGVSELVISLTVLAIGTSLPELAVGLIAVLRGNVDIAVGNVVGSNVFNLLAILGVAATIAGGLTVSNQALIYDIPIMCAAALFGGCFCITGKTLSRWEGALLLLGYAGYIFFLVNRA
ncbi:MAG: calcium/sodium antiporter [Thermoguttaceae bacterium]|nr:calcium/sodium antiporter [Thermoguttaceae bacterium]